jgi:tetratricopeptide (TPR) repeat protein
LILNVTRLKPRSGTYDDALDAFGSGSFSSCVDLLSESSSIAAVILRARALIRLGDALSATEMLGALDFSDASHELAAEALALRCYALYVLKRADLASSVAIEARARCFSAGLVAIEAELIFASSLASIRDGNLEAAESAALGILDLVDANPSWVTPSTYVFSLSFWRARACDVLASIAKMRSNYDGQADWLRQALEEFDKSGVHDDYVLVLLLANYADAAITLGRKDIIDLIVERSAFISWNSTLVAHEYRLFSMLAEAASEIGDEIGALRYFRRCLDCAPSIALQIRAGVERGRLLHDIGESFSAREEIDHALRLSRVFNWESAETLEQRQLLFLAAQVAKFDPAQALAMLTRYDGMDANSSIGVFVQDDRSRGEELMARAAILAANANTDRAIMLLTDAFETFTSGNLQGKAASAAAELAILTNEPSYIEAVQSYCADQPRSILSRKWANQAIFRLTDEAAVSVVARPAAASGSRPKLELLS